LPSGSIPARSYGDVAQMLSDERKRADGIEAVAIMTPNDTHYRYSAAALDAGLDVVCDKPVTHDFREACDLVERTRKNGRLFAIAHGYTAYPMTRHARQLVRDGAIGPVRLVQVEYIQAGMATKLEDGPINNRLRWVLDPARERTGAGDERDRLPRAAPRELRIRLSLREGRCRCPGADAGPQGRRLRFGADRVRGRRAGTFTVTQAAAGGENDIRLRVYGEKGMLEWWHRDPSYLRFALQGEPARTITRGDPFLRRRTSRWVIPRAAIPRDWPRRSATSTRKSRRSGWRARW
jgi:predicted dehydrogenase